MRFAEPLAFLALFLVPAVFLIQALAERRRAKVLARAGSVDLLERMALAGRDAGRTARWAQATCFALALAFVVVALARPQFGMRTEIRKGRGMDVILALDLSRSMMAQDVVPSRLKRSKIELKDLVDQLPGDRVGLVGFTTVALPLCPLTVDHAALDLQLAAASPEDLPRGGTSMAQAIEAAQRMLESSKAKGAAKAVVVVTDGEDHQGDAVGAAEKAKKAGIEVHVIGVGSRTGEPIPVYDENGELNGYVKDSRGQTVVSRLDETTLEKVANAGGGLLALPGGGGGLDLGPVKNHLATLKKAELEDREVRVYEERYQWALLPGLFFLLLATLIRPTRPRLRIVVGLLMVLLPRVGRAQPFTAEDPDVKAGNQALLEGRAADAAEAYEEAKTRLGADPRLSYNQGLAEAGRGELDAAISKLQTALEASGDPNLRGRAAFALGNAYRKVKKYGEAVDAYKRALIEDPRLSGARRNLEIAQSLLRIQEAQPKQENQDGDQKKDDQQKDQQEEDEEKPDAGPPNDASSGEDGGQNDQQDDQQGADAGQPEGQDGGAQTGGQDGGTAPPDAGNAGQQSPKEQEPKEEPLDQQDVQQLLDALEAKEKALKRKKLLEKIPRGRVEKDW